MENFPGLPESVIPSGACPGMVQAGAGIQILPVIKYILDTGFRRCDDIVFIAC
jgi:hypothetical protein